MLGCVDLVLVMSVTPGFGGQGLIEDSLERTRELAQLRAAGGYDYLIQMDGGINKDNAARIALAGCDVAVAGSAVFKAVDRARAISDLRNA